MRGHRKLYLPALGLLLFALGTYKSVRFNRSQSVSSGKYFYWSSIRLDSDPINRHKVNSNACGVVASDQPLCWEPSSIWVEPGWLSEVFILSALSAFLAARPIVHGFARLGVSEVTTFMISVPLLVFGWFYLLGWTAARLVWRRVRAKERPAINY